ncbi:iron uptake system component EfeO [Paenibacillus shirakamiensis]|uniref:Iron uptake system component EfeO n=1 Tax=Paenibacillus shirakamiensis TaxID=1265935 RepID=A0ABS4JKD0_9BACL|nr:iron uptake system protein EfeO [Paenibacillus shirakamiensis]MBP2002157.1 iron uptake system component EfeO [Paenibacillus shirakamiensis]
MKFRYAAPTMALMTTLLLSACSSGEEKAADMPKASTPAVSTETTTPVDPSETFKDAVSQYRTYVIQECDAFVTETDKFVKAVNSGDIDLAKQLYAPARTHYERIEPIAEALGDLDPNIDAREGDVAAADFRGFHRIEKALWKDKSVKDQKEFADRLLSDAKLLRAKVETVDIQPSLLVTGAVELLNEVSTSKVSGEEERYSRTDLYDFAANLEGADKIYELLKTHLASKDADLEKQIGDRFATLKAELDKYKKGTGYVSYDQLKQEEVRKLSQNLDALAEPLSNMGKLLGV